MWFLQYVLGVFGSWVRVILYSVNGSIETQYAKYNVLKKISPSLSLQYNIFLKSTEIYLLKTKIRRLLVGFNLIVS